MAAHVTLLFLFLLISLSSPLFFEPAEAGDELITIACNNSQVPEICKQCVESDNRSADADAAGIAGIIIDCLISHSNYLASNMSNLASNPELNSTKSAYERCFLDCSDAKENLNSAAEGLKKGIYDFAQLSLVGAAIDQSSCRSEFLSYKNTYVPPNVNFDLKVFDILSVAAYKIIGKL